MADLNPDAPVGRANDETQDPDGSDDSQLTEDEYLLSEDAVITPQFLNVDATDRPAVSDQSVVLMRAVLEEKPHACVWGDIMKRWDAVADKYNTCMGLVSARERVHVVVLRARVARLHKIFCDDQSTQRSELTPELLGLLAQFHAASLNKRAESDEISPKTKRRRRKRKPEAQSSKIHDQTPRAKRRRSTANERPPRGVTVTLSRASEGTRAEPDSNNHEPGKRRCRNPNAGPPAELFKLDLNNDTRMVRAYLDHACFIDQDNSWVFTLLETAAAVRGPNWTRDHARDQLDRLAKLYRSGDPALCAKTPRHLQLCSLLGDYTDCVLKLSKLRKDINQGVAGGGRTVDDLLLEAVAILKPFNKRSSTQQQAAWNDIATRFNTRLGMELMFTGAVCSKRYELLREAKLAGGVHESVRITPNQDKLLCQIEQRMRIAPTRTTMIVTCDDEDYTSDVETPVAQLAVPEATIHVTPTESKLWKLLLAEVVEHRPFEFGRREMLMWDRIRACVNFEMGHEIITSKETCRSLVVNLCRAFRKRHDPQIARLYPVHLELLKSVITQKGLARRTRDDNDGGGSVAIASILGAQERSDRAADVPSSGRGDAGSRGNSRSEDGDEVPDRGTDLGDDPDCNPMARVNSPDIDPNRSQRRVCSCNRAFTASPIAQPNANDLAQDRRLEQRVDALSKELDEIKRTLSRTCTQVSPIYPTDSSQLNHISGTQIRARDRHEESSAVV